MMVGAWIIIEQEEARQWEGQSQEWCGLVGADPAGYSDEEGWVPACASLVVAP
jgi:hypothetical protein